MPYCLLEAGSSDGTQGDSPGCGSVLIAFGESNAEALEKSNIPGKYIKLK